MGEHRSGAARRRKRRLAALEAQLLAEQYRVRDGGDVIDVAVTALGAVRQLAGLVNLTQMELKGDEMACLLQLIEDEIRAGRDLQHPA